MRTFRPYYLVVTSNDAPNAFPILRSRDLAAWELRGFVLPRGSAPAWAAAGDREGEGCDYWAPEMHRVGDEHRVYFVARQKGTGVLSIGLATSISPEGPYTAAPEPVLGGG